MKKFISFVGQLIGLHFAPDNHVVPILHLEQYDRVEKPGFFWIIPGVERTLPAVKTSIYVGNFYFEEVLSQDNLPLTIQMTVLFTFQPAQAFKDAAAVLVRADEGLLKTIVQDYTSQGIRRLALRHTAKELCNDATLVQIERDLTHFLKAEMRDLGIAPLKTGGLLLKEIYLPDKLKQAILDVKQDEAILDVLHDHPIPDMVEKYIRLLVAKGIHGHTGDSVLMMGTPEGMHPLATTDKVKGYSLNGFHSN